MVFLTEILGAEVVDVHQRRVGRVRDIAVRVEEPYPQVTALVLSRRGDVVVPWSAVRTIAGREVALRGTRDDLERRRTEGDEVWLARDVLDKQIVDLDGRRVVRVNDLQLTETQGAMLLVAADIGTRGILRRLGLEGFGKAVFRVFGRDLPMVLVSWDVVDPLERADDGTASNEALRLRISGNRIAKLHPADIADIVEELGARERRAIFESLDEDVAADTLEEMQLEDQVSLIEQMDVGRAGEILEEMPPDEVADILAELPEEHAQEILEAMEKEEADDVQELLAYRDDSAGGLMTTEFVAVREELTAQQCIDELRRMEPNAESVYYVFVVDAAERVHGVLSLRDLIVSPPERAIADIMIRHVVTVGTGASAAEVAAVLTKYNLLAIPVVDEEGRLQGIVTVDDAMDEVLPDSVKRRLPRTL